MNEYVNVIKECDECEYHDDNPHDPGCWRPNHECPYRIDYPPTEKQIAFAELISKILKIDLPVYCTKIAYKCYIEEYYVKYQVALLELEYRDNVVSW